ncbi:DNA polymerase III subunit delta [Polycladidibacter hongkongensis]|uniref:DNA polymerase III subunit delta n=1 Tax=Polycladidibacter hongkongensis TaxID=1647556 RepID=UPI00082FBCC4|nr:DNA polymerase III subunit delta [Pseudovibrio hongkongensis]
MVALKAAEIERFLSSPPTSVNLILVYGPDTGLVNERAQRLINSAADENSDPFSQIKLDSADIAGDANRLIDEALTIPLFGGRRTIWLRDNGGKQTMNAVEPLLANQNYEALVVIEAGDLKKTSALRKKIEASKSAYAVPCFADTERDLDRLIDEETHSMGLQISKEARMGLHSLLGADRMASRGELRKLCLYAMNAQRVELHHVEEIIGDASAFAMDELIDAASCGDTKTLDHGLERLAQSGIDAGVIANQALKHFQFLHQSRLAVEAGRSSDDIISSVRPPIFWKRKRLVSQQLSIWDTSRLERALVRLEEAVAKARLSGPVLSRSIVSHVLLAISQVASHASKTRR